MPYRREVDSWPWPADTLAERYQRVARSYREVLLARLPDACRALDERMIERGQHWIRPAQVGEVDLDELLTTREAAQFCQVQPTTLPQWRRRGLVATETDLGVRYRVRHLLDFRASQRLRRVRGKRAGGSL